MNYKLSYEKGRKARRELKFFSDNPYKQGRGRMFDFVLGAEWERGYRDEAVHSVTDRSVTDREVDEAFFRNCGI